jgi:glycosyltransferase involved in cell wall biosynthesis
MPEISVIVPVYNVEKYLHRCVDSILAQSFSNFELILVDDGSTDNSGKICDEYAQKYDNIKVYHINNKGVSYARNYGIKKAAGEYILFCDSDDTVLEGWIETLLKAIKKNNSAWVTCGCNYINDGTDEIIKIVVYNKDEKETFLKIKDYYKIFKLGISGYVWNHIYNTEIIRKHCLYFDEHTDYAEDALFNNVYLKYCNSICFINKPLYNYYSDLAGLSHKYFSDFYDRLKKVYFSRRPFIDVGFLPEFCYEYFYLFNLALNCTLDKRNKVSLIKKIKYNNYVINDKAFKDCLENMTLYKEDEKYVKLLKKGNYLFVYLRNRFK